MAVPNLQARARFLDLLHFDDFGDARHTVGVDGEQHVVSGCGPGGLARGGHGQGRTVAGEKQFVKILIKVAGVCNGSKFDHRHSGDGFSAGAHLEALAVAKFCAGGAGDFWARGDRGLAAVAVGFEQVWGLVVFDVVLFAIGLAAATVSTAADHDPTVR